VGINGAQNAAILAAEILATHDEALNNLLIDFKEGLKNKVIKANVELAAIKYDYKV